MPAGAHRSQDPVKMIITKSVEFLRRCNYLNDKGFRSWVCETASACKGQSLLCVPSHFTPLDVCLQAQKNTLPASSASNFTGVNDVSL